MILLIAALNTGMNTVLLLKIYNVKTSKTTSFVNDCHGVKGITSPKHPQSVTLLKAAE
jgi:hypothetical protein